jgi:hypothetical protein
MANNDQVGGTLSTAMAHDGASALTPPANGNNRNEKTISSDEYDADGHTKKETAIPVRTQGTDDNVGKRPTPGSGVVEGSGGGAGGGGNPEDPDAGHVGAAEEVIPESKPGPGASQPPASF